MSLDAGAGAPAASGPSTTAGTGGEDIAVRGQPQALTREQKLAQHGANLDDRVMAKRAAAERGEMPAVRKGPAQGPDGRFLPAGVTNIHAPAPRPKTSEPALNAAGTVAVSPDSQTPSTQTAQTSEPSPDVSEAHKAELAQRDERITALTQRDAEWTQIAEKALARIETLKGQMQRYAEMLEQAGISLDPRDIELAQLREGHRVRTLADERAQAEAQAAAQRAQQEQAEKQRNALINSTREVMKRYPQVAAGTAPWAEAIKLIYRGADPETAFALMAQKVAAAQPAQAPATFTNSGAGGSAQPKSRDPRDIAEKWKRTLGAAA